MSIGARLDKLERGISPRQAVALATDDWENWYRFTDRDVDGTAEPTAAEAASLARIEAMPLSWGDFVKAARGEQ